LPDAALSVGRAEASVAAGEKAAKLITHCHIEDEDRDELYEAAGKPASRVKPLKGKKINAIYKNG